MQMTVGEIVQACKGKLLCGDPKTVVTSVCIDSRKVSEGALFVPICGERSDGHQYIPSVLAAGAAATLTQEHTHAVGEAAWIRVPRTVEALQQIAAAYRDRFSIPLIGITGSVGKTTTKEMVALALSAKHRVMKTAGNFNSQIGLPLTLFQLEPYHTAAVVEMGMSEFGEMERLAAIARPTSAILTNIGVSHIENLHTKENIRAEKLHIADRFTCDSVLFLNGDDPLLQAVPDLPKGKKILYGTGEHAAYRAVDIRREGQSTVYTFLWPGGECPVHLPVLGKHNVLNSLAALAAADSLGVDPLAAAGQISLYTPPAMRQQVKRTGSVTILDDSYNSSPDSVQSSLDVLRGLAAQEGGRRVAVLADMLELGDQSQKAHFDMGIAAARMGVDWLIGVGPKAQAIAEAAKWAGIPLVHWCGETEEAVELLRSGLHPKDCVLVKGSRGMHTDRIVEGLLIDPNSR